MTDEAKFQAWMKQVDRIVSERTGLSVHDLEDCCYRDWYDDKVSAKSAASRAIKNAGGEGL